MGEKYFVSPTEHLLDSYKLARQVLESGFQPNYLVAIWRGGTPVGCAVQEFLGFNGIKTDHIPIRTSKYPEDEIDKPRDIVRVDGIDYIVNNANADDSLLIVDDVYDTGLTIEEVLRTLQTKARRNVPHDIRIATVYFKPSRNQTNRNPDFYLHETDRWLVLPYELQGLTEHEIRTGKGREIAQILFGPNSSPTMSHP